VFWSVHGGQDDIFIVVTVLTDEQTCLHRTGWYALDSYSGDTWFEFQPEHRLLWVKFLLVFFIPSMQIPGQRLDYAWPPPSKPSPVHHSSILPSDALYILDLLLVGWDCGHYCPIVPAPCDKWRWLWRNWWNEDLQGKPKYSQKTCPTATLSTTNPTWPDPGSNPGRRGGKPATNRLSYGTYILDTESVMKHSVIHKHAHLSRAMGL
jgi:hypothetical protein